MTIHGISSLVPGDLLRINYLPKNYLENAYFQITKINNEIGTSWNTSIEAKMRVIGKKETVKSSENRKLRKSYLRNYLQLAEIENIIHLIDNLKPIEFSNDLSPFIDNVFEGEFIGDASSELPLLSYPSTLEESVVKFALGMEERSTLMSMANTGMFRAIDLVDSFPLFQPEGSFAGKKFGGTGESIEVTMKYMGITDKKDNFVMGIAEKVFGGLGDETCAVLQQLTTKTLKSGRKFTMYTAGQKWFLGPYPNNEEFMNGIANIFRVVDEPLESKLNKENKEGFMAKLKTKPLPASQKDEAQKMDELGYFYFDWDPTKQPFTN